MEVVFPHLQLELREMMDFLDKTMITDRVQFTKLDFPFHLTLRVD